MNERGRVRMLARIVISAVVICGGIDGALAVGADPSDTWAKKILAQLSLEEKASLVHGIMALPLIPGTVIPPDAELGAGYIPGIARLGVPALKESDASLGVSGALGLRLDGATALPSGLATASSWNPEIANAGGAVAGQEAWRSGFNVLLGGGVNLARDPRNGRNFEYLGEDPLLAGTLAGEAIRGTQAQHVVSTVKHYAINDQETGRNVLSAHISESAMRESDLLAFEIAIERGRPGAVMCSYNRVNGDYACENEFLLNTVLKGDWSYRGWVMSDWGAVHSLEAALRGLDQESGEQLDKQVFFNGPLINAAHSDLKYSRRLDDMDLRILRSVHAVGAIDHPAVRTALDLEAGARAARRTAEQGIVLLRNERDQLPLGSDIKRIAVIGGHSDMGVVSGGGSSQVLPPGGPALVDTLGGEGIIALMRKIVFMPSSPLKAIRGAAQNAEVHFDDGRYPAAAAELARRADVAIVFVTQWMTEAFDAPDLSLPDGQDAVIAAVAAANPHTIVVLETGGPVLMPWLGQVTAVVEAWYPGIQGGEAIADVLFGKVNPSGRLPITFPSSLEQIPRPVLPGIGLPDDQPFGVDYPEGSDVGYRWFAKTSAKPLYAFGYGLSYTQFAHRDLKIDAGPSPHVSFVVANTGARAGADVAQVYLTSSPRRQQQRLLGWSRVELMPGESRRISIPIDARFLADWDQEGRSWKIDRGGYALAVGSSAADLTLNGSFQMAAARLKP
jgi:beta-glucosidase